MNNPNRYDTPPRKNQIEAMSKENALRMTSTDQIRAKYLNALVLNNRLTLGGRRTNKNKKKHKKLSRRRHHSKKNRKSMKRK